MLGPDHVLGDGDVSGANQLRRNCYMSRSTVMSRKHLMRRQYDLHGDHNVRRQPDLPLGANV